MTLRPGEHPCCGGPHTAQACNPLGHAVGCESYGAGAGEPHLWFNRPEPAPIFDPHTDADANPSLLRHTAVLDLEGPPDMGFQKGGGIVGTVAFSARHIGATRVELDVVRWIEMEYPRQIRVTIDPVPKERPREVVERVRQEARDYFAERERAGG